MARALALAVVLLIASPAVAFAAEAQAPSASQKPSASGSPAAPSKAPTTAPEKSEKAPTAAPEKGAATPKAAPAKAPASKSETTPSQAPGSGSSAQAPSGSATPAKTPASAPKGSSSSPSASPSEEAASPDSGDVAEEPSASASAEEPSTAEAAGPSADSPPEPTTTSDSPASSPGPAADESGSAGMGTSVAAAVVAAAAALTSQNLTQLKWQSLLLPPNHYKLQSQLTSHSHSHSTASLIHSPHCSVLTPTRRHTLSPHATMRRFHLAAAALLVLLPFAAAATGGKASPVPAKAKAPAAPPTPPNITALMAKGGCKAFAALVAASPDALSTFQSAAEGGVTAFCPTDDAMKSFMPSYKNLTADGKVSLLLFQAVPAYYTLGSLKSSNGPMNTLATDGAARNYNFTVQNKGDQVTIKTEASDDAARVKSTVYQKDPVAIYAVDTVLEPVELFDPVEAPAPAPAPVADAPKASKRARHQRHVADAPGPAGDDATPADQRKNSKKNAAAGAPCLRWLSAVGAAVAVASALA
ncbi:uncharacterized protein LOC133898623 [Phragmites australis]|uniref:uncharacterized protein LOC133898623 n=1 Tax=Phragmites australis TaxID=29695 RepID=UPI002D766C7B|nr:uncharacterized protein LOC133898623 [Phragmites australis]